MERSAKQLTLMRLVPSYGEWASSAMPGLSAMVLHLHAVLRPLSLL